MSEINEHLAKFLAERDAAEAEAERVLLEAVRDPGTALRLREQLIIDDLLSRAHAPERKDFANRVLKRTAMLDSRKHFVQRVEAARSQVDAGLARERSRPSRQASPSRSGTPASGGRRTRSPAWWLAPMAMAAGLLLVIGLVRWGSGGAGVEATAEVATVGHLLSSAQVSHAGASSNHASGTDLFIGDGITAVDAVAISLRDGTRLDLAPGSTLRVPAFAADRRELALDIGSLQAVVAKQIDGAMIFVTTQARVTVIGTRFTLTTTATSTHLDLTEGRVSFRDLASGKESLISAGGTADAGAAPGPGFGMMTPTGTIVREVWSGVPGWTIAQMPVGTAPTAVVTMTSLESPSLIGQDYAVRIRGYLVPSVTGRYRFWIAADDQAELWLSTTMDPAQAVKIAWNTNTVVQHNWTDQPTQRSAEIPLITGQRYYLQVVHKQATGNDCLAVGWLKPGQTGDGPSEIVPGSALAPLPSPPGSPTPPPVPLTGPGVSTQPRDTTVVAGARATFTVAAHGTGLLTYRWLKNDTVIPGATSATCAFDAQIIDHGAAIRCLVTDRFASALSDMAILRIAGQPGTILREFWLGAPGWSIGEIPLLLPPSGTSLMTDLEGPTDIGQDYGTRVRGYLLPPLTGNYVFWVSGDDNCEFWLSSSEDPAQKAKVAWITGGTTFSAPQEWDKVPTQRSAPVPLTAGRNYYLEVLHKQGSGHDHWAVGWLKPGETGTNPSGVVPGSAVVPFQSTSAH